MARILPEIFVEPALSGGEAAELATLAKLKSSLSSDYSIFHSVHWSRDRDPNVSVGEADFIIVNRSGECLVIEQKMGSLVETPAGLIKRYVDGQKDVSKQIHRTLSAIRDQFKRQSQGQLSLEYLIYCPDYRVRDLNAVGLAPSRIVDARDADHLAARIGSVLRPGETSDHGRRVMKFLEGAFDLVPDIHSHVTAGDRIMTRLTGGLADVISSIEMTPMRLRVLGTAGCGKSVVASRFSNFSGKAGKKALLICFNRPLAEKLRLTVDAGTTVETFYGFMDRFLKERGHTLNYSRMGEPVFWSEVQEMVVAETIDERWTFDTLIIDEGQDIEAGWVDIIRLFLTPNADILWLEDADQSIRLPNDVNPHSSITSFDTPFVTYRVRSNYRTPQTIARYISDVLPFKFIAANPLNGLGVGLSNYTARNEQAHCVSKLVTELLRSGFKHHQIVILSLKGLARATFASETRVGAFTLAKPTGQYDLLGNQILEDGQLRFDTIYRYKGQQAPAVILTDIDSDTLSTPHMERVMFCAMTRATLRLELVVSKSSSWLSRLQL